MCLMPYANNKGADQPTHPRSLVSVFIVRCLDNIIPLVSISEISSLYLASETAHAGLCLPWSQTLKTGFLLTRIKINMAETWPILSLLRIPPELGYSRCHNRITITEYKNTTEMSHDRTKPTK